MDPLLDAIHNEMKDRGYFDYTPESFKSLAAIIEDPSCTLSDWLDFITKEEIEILDLPFEKLPLWINDPGTKGIVARNRLKYGE